MHCYRGQKTHCSHPNVQICEKNCRGPHPSLLTAVIVLVHCLQPAYIIVCMRQQVHIEHAWLRWGTCLHKDPPQHTHSLSVADSSRGRQVGGSAVEPLPGMFKTIGLTSTFTRRQGDGTSTGLNFGVMQRGQKAIICPRKDTQSIVPIYSIDATPTLHKPHRAEITYFRITFVGVS